MNSPRSRRVVLALGALAFGLSACGDPSTSPAGGSAPTTVVAAQVPPKIKIAGPGGGATGSVAASAESAPVADGGQGASRIFAPSITYVFDGEAPIFDTPAGAWYFPVGAVPTDAQLTALGAAFGFTDAPRPLPEDQGGGWVFGVNDGTGAGLQVSAGATLDWWFYPDPTTFTPVEGCAVAAVEPAIDPAVVDPAVDVAVGEVPPSPSPDAVCPEPTPPAGVPSEADALAKARDLFTSIGLDLSGYELSVSGDEWGRNVTVAQMLDGHRSPVAQSVGFGENGTLTWAGGVLAQPIRGADYPRVSVADAVKRLNDQSMPWGSTVRGAVVDVAADGPLVGNAGGAPIEPALGAPEPAIAVDPPVCVSPDPGILIAPGELEAATGGVAGAATNAGAATSGDAGAPTSAGAGDTPAAPPDAPIDPPVDVAVDVAGEPGFGCGQITPPEPITIHLNGVTEGLTMVWATDNTIWLLPAYDFTDADGGQYQINAVADGFIENVPAEAVPAPAPPADGDATDAVFAIPTVDAANVLIGLDESAASDLARANGWIMRVVQQDGESLSATEDFSENRLNVALDGGKVTSILSIG